MKRSRIAMLLLAGADMINRRDEDKMGALEFAVESCSPEVIQALIDRGGEVDGPPNADQTQMHAAQANNAGATMSIRKSDPLDMVRINQTDVVAKRFNRTIESVE